MITVSKIAAEKIKQSTGGDQAENLMLRIAAKRKNDGSIEYLMGFDETTENDERYVSNNITIIVSADSKLLLNGTELDFVELDNGQSNFIFKNPNDPNYKPADDSAEHHF